jgi:malonate-semialdehyde dehydrogenase (acetylating) / methylmalonate-semialdehyde dehydrogenase
MKQIHHHINGHSVPATSGRSGKVFNPATGEQASEVGFASVADVDAAVSAAADALVSWGKSSIARRVEVLFKIRETLSTNRKELAELITSEHGKTVPDAMGEFARGLECVDFACGIPQLLKGGYSEGASTGVDVYTLRQPVGIVACITPFNFPSMVPLWMIANAIACGNTVVLKPSEKDPSAPTRMVEMFEEAGLPAGVINVVQGDKVAVDRLLEHPSISAASFVGSTPIARYIYETGTKHGKRVQALGGAKNHMVVLPDADIDMAADAAVSAAYGSAGERCMAISVAVAVGGVADELIDAIKVRMPKVVIGPGNDPNSEMGPLITREHRDKVASYIDIASNEGATVVVDGRDQHFDGNGYFLGLSLIDNVTQAMRVYQEEIFGPVLCVVRVDTYAEAVQLVNEHEYGNGCAIFTRDGGAARQFQNEVLVGMIGVNVPIPVPVAYYSFGGWKNSLFGDNHMYGPDGIQFFTRTKVVTSRWPDPASSQVDLGFPRNR